ncbi:protease inhibitor I42 family protein [Brevundimonas subvibrioides]|uniref:protease inhibitor I42 family protein n=1 Tax=Brevundimonas subvibrioides TaxID=74313 RepID=UPI0032D5925D
MMKRFAASIVSLALLTGCGTAGGEPEEGTDVIPTGGVVEGVQGGETRLRVGQTMTVALGSNSTTGYQWQVSDVEGGVLVPGTPFGEEIVEPHAPGMVGVGGTTHWHYLAARPGAVTLTFTYRRAWERDTPPAQTERYRVVVR